MNERPIIMSAPMVRALLGGTKTQTRRVIKPQPPHSCSYVINGAGTHALCFGPSREFVPPTARSIDHRLPCPYGVPLDRLWVREPWYYDLPPHKLGGIDPEAFDADALYFRADGECCQQIAECSCAEIGKPKWRPGIFLPRWASRITLEVVGLRVQRVQEISEADAAAEGCRGSRERVGNGIAWRGLVGHYAELWDSINATRGHPWSSNPWVWVVEFRVVER